MAGEILHSSLEADLRLAATISGDVRVTLTDMASIRTVPGAVEYLGDVAGTGSDTHKTPFHSLNGFSATAAENTAIANTALTDTSASIAVVRHGLRREISDLAELTARGPGDVSVSRLAANMAMEYEIGWMDSLAAVIAGFSASVGSSGVDLSVSNIFDAIATLEIADVSGPFFAMLHPRQLADLQASLRAEGGALAFSAATAEMLAVKGQGYAGNFLGIEIYKSSRTDLANTNADRAGAIWGAGAIGWRTGTPSFPAGAIVGAPNPFVNVELYRPDSAGTTAVIGHAYFGLGLLEDARGVAVVTDA